MDGGMDDFTPPPSENIPSSSVPSIRHGHGQVASPSWSSNWPVRHPASPSYSSLPPELPPPPTDLPQGYRAVTPRSFRRLSDDKLSPISTTSSASPPLSPHAGALGLPARIRSAKLLRHEVHKVRLPSGQTVLRKQKLRPSDEQSDSQTDSEMSVAHPEYDLPRPGSMPSRGARGSNFSRPYTATATATAGSATSSTMTSPTLTSPHTYSLSPSVSPAARTVAPAQFLNSPIQKHFSPTTVSVPATVSTMSARKTSPALDIKPAVSVTKASRAVPTVNTISPRRIRRRKDPATFNVLIAGAANSGKSSFIDFLKASFPTLPDRQSSVGTPGSTPRMPVPYGSFVPTYLETDFDGERVALTLWDSPGLERNIVDLQLSELLAFVESKFEDTFMEEQKVARTPGARDTHIHCVLLLLDPGRLEYAYRQSLKPTNEHAHPSASRFLGLDKDLDTMVIRGLAAKTTVIPIIGKADSMTQIRLAALKRRAWDCLQLEGLNAFEELGLGSSDESGESDGSDDESEVGIATDTSFLSSGKSATNTSLDASSKSSSEDAYMPFSIISPDSEDPSIVGRRYAWGVADPHNPAHSDFARLRETIFFELRDELRSSAREKGYESYRSSRLKRTPQNSIRRPPGVSPLGIVDASPKARKPVGYSQSVR